MAQSTLTQKIEENFDSIALKRTAVKVPRLRIRKSKAPSKKSQLRQKTETPTSAIIGMILKAAAERKKDEKEKKKIPDSRQYKAIKDERPLLENSGYGTLSRSYGGSVKSSYADYGKLFSYLGSFKSKNAFEGLEGSPTQLANTVIERGNQFYFVDREVIDSGVRTMKYLTSGASNGELAVVPVGMNSSDWEKFKLWQKIDPVMFNLKMNTL